MLEILEDLTISGSLGILHSEVSLCLCEIYSPYCYEYIMQGCCEELDNNQIVNHFFTRYNQHQTGFFSLHTTFSSDIRLCFITGTHPYIAVVKILKFSLASEPSPLSTITSHSKFPNYQAKAIQHVNPKSSQSDLQRHQKRRRSQAVRDLPTQSSRRLSRSHLTFI